MGFEDEIRKIREAEQMGIAEDKQQEAERQAKLEQQKEGDRDWLVRVREDVIRRDLRDFAKAYDTDPGNVKNDSEPRDPENLKRCSVRVLDLKRGSFRVDVTVKKDSQTTQVRCTVNLDPSGHTTGTGRTIYEDWQSVTGPRRWSDEELSKKVGDLLKEATGVTRYSRER
jgi:hypothetical protein